MRNLLYIIYRFSALVTFILLELLSVYLIINFNKSQGEIWSHSSNLLVGGINKKVGLVEDFFTLKSKNDSLFRANAELLQTIINYRIFSDDKDGFQAYELAMSDSVPSYKLITAIVTSRTVNLRNNYITIDKGSAQGVKPGMGVITDNGVAGIVKSTTEKYASVILILNSQSRISCKVADKDYHGNLVWKSSDTRIMNLNDVPKHADISIGDRIVTSGYSISFPKSIPIGKITDYKIQGGVNSYSIEVTLDYDLSKAKHVYVVQFKDSEEKDKLLSSLNE